MYRPDLNHLKANCTESWSRMRFTLLLCTQAISITYTESTLSDQKNHLTVWILFSADVEKLITYFSELSRQKHDITRWEVLSAYFKWYFKHFYFKVKVDNEWKTNDVVFYRKAWLLFVIICLWTGVQLYISCSALIRSLYKISYESLSYVT